MVECVRAFERDCVRTRVCTFGRLAGPVIPSHARVLCTRTTVVVDGFVVNNHLRFPGVLRFKGAHVGSHFICAAKLPTRCTPARAKPTVHQVLAGRVLLGQDPQPDWCPIDNSGASESNKALTNFAALLCFRFCLLFFLPNSSL